jgi:thioredoxin 1
MLIVKRFTAAWCIPCKQLAPVFNELQSEMPNVQFQTIDVDMDKVSALENGVSSIPTVIFEKDGQQVYRFSGVIPKAAIAGAIKQHI